MGIRDASDAYFVSEQAAVRVALWKNNHSIACRCDKGMLRIEIVKRTDGGGLLRCIRHDGSATWQKQETHAAHFALHDLTHFAVETVLGYRRGFFGLVADGWDLEDTTGKGKHGPLPDEATEVEKIVGLFDSERASGQLWTAEEFNIFAPRPLSTEEIQRIRTVRGNLFQRWSGVQPGDKLELQFDPD